MIEGHTGHKSEKIPYLAPKFRDQFGSKLPRLQEVLELAQWTVKELRNEEYGAGLEASRSEKSIRERCQEMRKTLSKYEQELLSEVRQFRTERMRKIKARVDEVERQIALLNNFIRYVEEMRESGSHSDVVCCGKELVAMAERLPAACREVITRQPTQLHMQFLPYDGAQFERKLVGEYKNKGKQR